jgi:uncharacterized protein (TIGR03437 family)
MRSGSFFSITLVIIFALLITLAFHLCGVVVSASRATASNKVSAWLTSRMQADDETEFLVILNDEADLSAAESLETKQQKGEFVREALWQRAQVSQASLLTWLKARDIEHRAFYIVNAVLVKGNRQLLETIAARSDVSRIEGNPQILNRTVTQPITSASSHSLNQTATIENGITNTRAPEVWAMGFTGQGMVLGSADTGVEWDHPALKSHYRGWNGTTASHDYNWHDSIHSGGGDCGFNTTAACDDDRHGTHTTGTAIGDDGAGNQIGMAPGAKFIGCRNMDRGVGTPATYLECMEFFLAPYPVNGTPAQGDVAKAPDVTINSWSCPPSEGCAPETLQRGIEAQRAAGIMTVVAAGNSGSACSSVNEPPGLYAASYTIGALNAVTNTIASFSSRGPVIIDGSNRLKPDLVAPGVSVRSSIRGGGYASFGGTSMATPHVAGAVALLWSAVPSLRKQIAVTEKILNDSAVRITTNICGTDGVPNNTYGFGRLDIKAAVDLARSRTLATVSAATYNATEAASESIVTSFGNSLTTSTQSAAAIPLPDSLSGITVKVTDSAGAQRTAPLFFVSPTQINWQIPVGTANGVATVNILSGNSTISTGLLPVTSVAPGIFSANSSGSGLAAALVLRIRNGQAQAYEPIALFNGSQFTALPIDLSNANEQVYLVLFGTGLRFHSGLSSVKARIGGADAQVSFAGAQGSLVGLDQINVLLPQALTGRGEVDVMLTVNNKNSNIVKVNIR